jgi:hypothetical protein
MAHGDVFPNGEESIDSIKNVDKGGCFVRNRLTVLSHHVERNLTLMLVSGTVDASV